MCKQEPGSSDLPGGFYHCHAGRSLCLLFSPAQRAQTGLGAWRLGSDPQRPICKGGERPCHRTNRLCKGLRVLTAPSSRGARRPCWLIGRAVWQRKDVSLHCEAAWKPSHVSLKDKGTQVFEMQKYFDLTTSVFKGKSNSRVTIHLLSHRKSCISY